MNQKNKKRNNRQKKAIRIVSLFSGCGGSDLGVQGGFAFLGKRYGKLSTEIIFANDNDLASTETYRANFGDHVVHKSITKIISSEIPNHDILIGGFPCQAFSIVGQRNGLNDPRGLLFEEMARILKDKSPKAFIAENVKGLANIKKGKVLKLIIKEFSIGYDVKYKVLHSADFDVPQKRERVFIVGIRKDLRIKFAFPKPVAKQWVPLKKVLLKKREFDKKYYFSQKAVEGLKKSNKAFDKGRAQNIEEPCNTISAHLAKVSLNGTDPVLLIGHEKYRRFTPLEAARIQSFPDNFKFVGGDLEAYKQIGNAIPPVLMWHVAKALIKQLQGK
ncbi:DNA (cytosine-5-)-methyltransferase [bacterium]|nr:DNA (cytosine-5-)-methyltransferase [bacterium]